MGTLILRDVESILTAEHGVGDAVVHSSLWSIRGDVGRSTQGDELRPIRRHFDRHSPFLTGGARSPAAGTGGVTSAASQRMFGRAGFDAVESAHPPPQCGDADTELGRRLAAVAAVAAQRVAD